MRLKVKRRKTFRSFLGCEGKRDEAENLLILPEWFSLYRETCTGLLKMDTPSSRYQLLYFIYCAVVTNKFADELAKVYSLLLLHSYSAS